MNSPSELLTLYQIARELQLSLATIRRYIRMKTIGHVRVSERRVLISREQFDAYLESRRVDPCLTPDSESSATSGYLHVRPEYLKSAVKAVDEYFAELEPLANRPISRMQLEEQPLPSEWSSISNSIPIFSADALNDLPDDDAAG